MEDTHKGVLLCKGSVILERQYGVDLVCKVISDVEVCNGSQQEFKAQVVSVNGVPASKDGGKVVDYLIGGTYSVCVEVLEY